MLHVENAGHSSHVLCDLGNCFSPLHVDAERKSEYSQFSDSPIQYSPFLHPTSAGRYWSDITTGVCPLIKADVLAVCKAAISWSIVCTFILHEYDIVSFLPVCVCVQSNLIAITV